MPTKLNPMMTKTVEDTVHSFPGDHVAYRDAFRIAGPFGGEPTVANCWMLTQRGHNFGNLNISSFLLSWTNCWSNSLFAGEFRHHSAHVTSLQWPQTCLTDCGPATTYAIDEERIRVFDRGRYTTISPSVEISTITSREHSHAYFQQKRIIKKCLWIFFF